MQSMDAKFESPKPICNHNYACFPEDLAAVFMQTLFHKITTVSLQVLAF
jgi:hypothetical protein